MSKDAIKRVLRFLRITDENDDFSISNLIGLASAVPLVVSSIQSLVEPTVEAAQRGDWPMVAASVAGFAVYGAKRWKQRANAEQAQYIAKLQEAYYRSQDQLAELRDQITKQ